MINDFFTFLQNNQIASGGLTITVVGSLLYGLKTIIPGMVRKIWSRFIHSIEIHDDDPSFAWLVMWLQSREDLFTLKPKRFTVVTGKSDHDVTRRLATNLKHFGEIPGSEENEVQRKRQELKFKFFPAPGFHFLRYKGKWVMVNRIREEASGESGSTFGFYKKEKLIMTGFQVKRDFFSQMMEEVKKDIVPNEDKNIRILHQRFGDEWSVQGHLPPRPKETIVLEDGVIEELIEDLDWFLNNKKWYIDRGIPYRRGYLLHGPPGNGKSSLIHCLASSMDMDIAVLRLSNSNMNDNDLSRLLSAPELKQTIVVIEDIDCAIESRDEAKEQSNNKGVTFSGLLNAIDGIGASEGRVIIMTTNFLQRLDTALVRPGRADLEIYLDNASREQIKRMYERFFGEEGSEDFAEMWPEKEVSMAAVQGFLQKAHRSPKILKSQEEVDKQYKNNREAA